ncbi:hypothetical protein M8J75_014232 [Diaphorina citri]|nr:hypothetical protein M8J75_014232 [Diaphorina citri]
MWYVEGWRGKHSKLAHRKSISFPESIHGKSKSNALEVILGVKSWASVPELRAVQTQKKKPLSDPPRRKMKPASRSKAFSPSVLNVDYLKPGATDSYKDPVPEAADALGYFLNTSHSTPATTPIQHPNSIFVETPPPPSSNYYNINITSCAGDGKRKSFMQDGGNSILPMALGFFPKPAKGESLLDFLSSSQYSRSNAELDRENSHFYIAEAVISVVEQVKWEMELQKLREAEEKLIMGIEASEQPSMSRSDSLATMQSNQESFSDISSSPYQSARCSLSLEDESSATLLHNSCSDSMISLSIDSMHRQSPPNSLRASSCSGLNSSAATNSSSSSLSAEGVALSLLRKFSDQQLPAASDIHWLVSEKDASREVSPLPNSWPNNDETENNSTLLRGTYEWAPPRPQIIFFPHPTPVRHVLMMKQNLRCAGCGMRVALQYASKFRYCSYLGRYFCTGCHSNQTAMIPGKIIQAWNFKKYPVSKFSYELLDSMMSDPLFRISDINSSLFRKVQVLGRVNKLRLQLNSLKDFLLMCRFAETMRAILLGQEPHLLMDPDVYSMQDLLDVKSGALYLKLKDLVSACSSHVYNCELCLARGFICELCNSEEVIFPWQLSSVHRCNQCGACFHTKCHSQLPCKRCIRMRIRRDSMVNSDHG